VVHDDAGAWLTMVSPALFGPLRSRTGWAAERAAFVFEGPSRALHDRVKHRAVTYLAVSLSWLAAMRNAARRGACISPGQETKLVSSPFVRVPDPRQPIRWEG